MSTITTFESMTSCARPGIAEDNSSEVLWFAAYTSANHEKRVATHLLSRSIEHFLPLYQSMRRWKDRTVQLPIPLFPGYVFVRFAPRDRLQVQQVPGLVKLVGFNETPAALLQDEIDSLRTGLTAGVRAQPHPYLSAGRRVRIKNGPLAGREGVLLRKKGNMRVVLSIDLIRRSIVVDADEADLDATDVPLNGYTQ